MQQTAKKEEDEILNNMYQTQNPSPQSQIENYNGPTLEFIDWLSPQSNPN